MLKPEQVPPGLALIARKAWAEGVGPTNDDDWNAAIAAAINAWPGMERKDFRWRADTFVEESNLVLPLTEPRDET